MKRKKQSVGKKISIALSVLIVFLCGQWMYIGWRFQYGPFRGLGHMRLEKMEGNVEKYDFSHIQPMENSPLENKKVLFLGSSVTNGAAALYQSIPEYFGARMGCTFIKEAVDGTTLTDNGSDSYIQRLLNHVDADEKIDLLVCQLSTNDASKGLPLGEVSEKSVLEEFDTGTITGAMEYIICYAEQTWGCPVVFYTNARFESEDYQEMVERLYQLADKWEIGILDLWSDDGFNQITETERALYMKDNIHPYKAGYRDWWGPELERQLCDFLSGKE